MKRSRPIAGCVSVTLAAFFFISFPVRAAFFNYLYIEASEGNSSGGHAAVQFGDDIYHYQHLDSGLIRIFRRDRADFHFLYRYLQNRPIHESRIEVSDESFQLFHNQFKRQFLAQEKLYRLIDDLDRERHFIRHLLHPAGEDAGQAGFDVSALLQLKGVGLFFADGEPAMEPHRSGRVDRRSSGLEQLRLKLEQRYSPDFLRQRRERTLSGIKSVLPARWPDLPPQSTGDTLPPTVYSLTDGYLDKLTALYALRVIGEGRPLLPQAYLQTNRPEFELTGPERRMLQDLRNRFEAGLLKLFDSARPDWGYAALVTMARYLAVDYTLKSGYWAFIDDFAGNSEWVGPDDYLPHRGQLEILLHDAGTALERNRQVASRIGKIQESAYSAIEMAANRYAELLKTRQNKEFRRNGEMALPSRSIGLAAAPVPKLTRDQLEAALAEVDGAENRLMRQLNQDYRYDLLTRNCVTELFRSLNQALLSPHGADAGLQDRNELVIAESKKRLGGYVPVSYNFIPFISYQSVRTNYHVTDSRDLDSFRIQELAKLKRRRDPVMIALAESNIVSSSLYHYNPDDALFLFFTDDHPVLRPVLGIFNTAVGIGQSLYGVFSWPFDSGKNLKSGAKGILMSLPEFLFFNMRKGSYKYLSASRLANENLSSP